MSPTRTTPDLFTSLKADWDDAMQQWWDQTQTAIDPWKQAWESAMPGAGAGMPSGRHHRHASCSHGRDSVCCESCEHEHHEHEHHEHEHHHHDDQHHAHGQEDGHEHGLHEHGHHEHGTCGCEPRACGSRCHCCVPESDVLLNARAGERRVLPFLLRNPWRREREVSLAVGPWQVCHGGRVEIQAAFDAGETLTLQPCESRVVSLMVLVRGICDELPKSGKTPDTKDSMVDRSDLGYDVDSCVSAYADVRFEGCARPQRLGVVVHPARCEAIELPCDCGRC